MRLFCMSSLWEAYYISMIWLGAAFISYTNFFVSDPNVLLLPSALLSLV
jgi:hypothetical protein